MKKLIIISILVFDVYFVNAQYSINQMNSFYIDGIRSTQNFYGSTARSIALGGAFASLGGDLGSISINPAGIGVYRGSEFAFSTGFNALNTSSNYLGYKRNDISYKFNLANIGAVFTFNNNTSSGWISTNLAIGYNKLNNFSNSYSIQGETNISSATSLTDEFLYNANLNGGSAPGDLDPFWERLAYDALLIDVDSGTTYTYQSPYTGIKLLQRHTLNIRGSGGEYFFGFGANYNNQLYLGVSLNIKSMNYDEEFYHTEYDFDAVTTIDHYQFSHFISTSATGFNVKLGAIYKPIDMLRIGISIHTPTVMKVTQEYDSHLYSVMNNGGINDIYPSDYGILPPRDEYDISTPFRAIGGLSVTFQQYGLLSIDYEFIDYRSIKFSNSNFSYDFSSDNEANKNFLRATNNIRVGGELKMGSMYFRGGYAFYASPYASSEINKNANTNIFSGGLGYRENNFYIDFAYSLLSRNEKYFMYYEDASAVNLNTNQSNFSATVGFRF